MPRQNIFINMIKNANAAKNDYEPRHKEESDFKSTNSQNKVIMNWSVN